MGQVVGEEVLESTQGEDGPKAGGLSSWVWTRMFLGQERVGYRSGIVEDRAPGGGDW